LIDQGGRQKFLDFVGEGMKTDNWSEVTKEHYGYASLQVLQDQWLEWVKQGSPTLSPQRSGVLAGGDRSQQPLYRAQSSGNKPSVSNGKNLLAAHAVNGSSASKQIASSDDQGWGPVAMDGSAGNDSKRSGEPLYGAAGGASSHSVYERSATTENPDAGLATAGRNATSPPPAPVNTTVADNSQREPEFIAQRDSGGAQDHHVLLQWTRAE
jgi:hypothetical protein